MTTSVIELSKRLQRSLDSNYNVIDLVAVFEIIRILEGTPITTEQLETTRLAKYINQLRRKTTNEQLARQAKNLLKKWRDNLMPAIASGAPVAAQPPAATAAAVAPQLTNGLTSLGQVRSQPTTPSRPAVIAPTSTNNANHLINNSSTTSTDQVITIPDEDDNESKSQGSSNQTASRRFGGSNSNFIRDERSTGLSIPSELTNFYLKNKKIIDGSSAQPLVKEENPPPTLNHNNHHHYNNSSYPEADSVDNVVEERQQQQKRRGRKKGSKGVDSTLGSSMHTLLFNSNSNSGFGDNNSATATGTSSSTVGKKVKTTRQLVADLKFRNEQSLRNNASYAELSGDNNNHSNLSSPMSASNDSHHMFHHHGHNQHPISHNHEMFHSAPVTPSLSMVKREPGATEEDSLSARKREKKRRRLEKERATAADRLVRAKIKREKTPPPASGMNFLNQVDEDIWQLKNRMPPIDRKAILREMKAEKIALAQGERQCTCQLVECTQEEAERACGVVIASLDDIPAPPPLEQATLPDPNADPNVAVTMKSSSSSPGHTTHPSTSSVPVPPVNVLRNKKSIFDDDDVVMDEHVNAGSSSPAAAVLASTDKNNNSEEEGPNSNEGRFPVLPRPPQFDAHAQFQHHQQQQQQQQQLPVPVAVVHVGEEEAVPEEEERVFYKIVEEPGCPVKRRKVDLLRLNADYHLAALHQLYVPGVNGNWSAFSDLGVLRGTTDKKHEGSSLKRKRRRSSSESSDEDVHQQRQVYTSSKGSADNSSLIECLGRLQDSETLNVNAVVPLVNPFFHFLKAEPGTTTSSSQGTGNALVNMAGMLPRHVPLRTDFGIVVIPPVQPPPTEEGEVATNPPPTDLPIQFNRELAKELDIEGICEGVKGDVYEPKELEKFLEAMLRLRLPKFQMANLFYKRSWPGAEDRENNLSLELLNSLYLNRVLEFRRRRRRHATTMTHRKRRRKGDEEDDEGASGEEEEEEMNEDGTVEVADVHVFDGFLEMQTMALRNREQEQQQQGRNNPVAVQSARRLFYVNDDRLFGHQPSILDEVIEGDQLPVLDDWDLFRVRFQSLEFLPPVLSATARILYASWPRMRWNFLLDYFKARQCMGVAALEDVDEDDEEGGEVVRIHENNFRLPSFNHLTEENLLGIRQRRGRKGQGDEDLFDEPSMLPTEVKCEVESFREREFVRVCMAKWPELFEGLSFDYDQGVMVMRHADVDRRWRFMMEFRDLLKEVTRLGVAAEEEDEEEEEAAAALGRMTTGRNGTTRPINKHSDDELDDDDGNETDGGGGASKLRPVDAPQVELFKEWHESVQVQSYNDELLTILPYVVID